MTELRAEDLRSMLEPKPARHEKLSISALRQRIGCVFTSLVSLSGRVLAGTNAHSLLLLWTD